LDKENEKVRRIRKSQANIRGIKRLRAVTGKPISSTIDPEKIKKDLCGQEMRENE